MILSEMMFNRSIALFSLFRIKPRKFLYGRNVTLKSTPCHGTVFTTANTIYEEKDEIEIALGLAQRIHEENIFKESKMLREQESFTSSSYIKENTAQNVFMRLKDTEQKVFWRSSAISG